MIYLLIMLHIHFWSQKTDRQEISQFKSEELCEAKAKELNEWASGINHYICVRQNTPETNAKKGK